MNFPRGSTAEDQEWTGKDDRRKQEPLSPFQPWEARKTDICPIKRGVRSGGEQRREGDEVDALSSDISEGWYKTGADIKDNLTRPFCLYSREVEQLLETGQERGTRNRSRISRISRKE